MSQLRRTNGWLVLAGFLVLAYGSHADFVAFYDHAPGAGTHQYTLSVSELLSGSGFLTNYTDGITTPVTMTATVSNNVTSGNAAENPAPGTPAYVTFNGFVDFKGANQEAVQLATNSSFIVLTFTGLDPSRRYDFKGSAVRGNATYTNRWSKISILGAAYAAARHTSNALTSAQAPADLGPNDSAFCFGVNTNVNQGDMAVWEDIDPGPDGSFQIVSTRYVGFVPNGGSSTLGVPNAYAITGVRLEEFRPDAVSILSGPTPAALTVEQGQNANFQISAAGTSPQYQWYREDGQPIVRSTGTNSSTLTITNADPAAAGVYRVRISNSLGSINSDPVTLTVNADRTPPSVVFALAYADGTNFLISFSESLDTARPLQTTAFQIHLTAGAGNLMIARAGFTNGTNVLLSTAAPRAAAGNYSISIGSGAVADKSGNGVAAAEVPVSVQLLLLSFGGTPWRYRADGVDLGSAWYLDAGYDDSGWQNGTNVFDGKTPQPPGRSTVAGFPVMTQLPLTNNAWPSTNLVIPTYYFRAHFSLPTTPDHITSLKLRTLVDDFEDLFINQQEAHRNPGYPSTNPPPAFGYSGGSAVSTAAIAGPYDLAASSLQAGENVAAVIVNQANGATSDVTFACELVAIIDRFVAAPRLMIGPDPNAPGKLLITWPDAGSQLYEAAQADAAPAAWSLVSGVSGSSYSFSPGGTQKFYAIRR